MITSLKDQSLEKLNLKQFINEKTIFSGNIGRIRDIKIHEMVNYIIINRGTVENAQVKKVFILTGEPSGDKLASKIIKQLKESPNLEYLSVGGKFKIFGNTVNL